MGCKAQLASPHRIFFASSRYLCVSVVPSLQSSFEPPSPRGTQGYGSSGVLVPIANCFGISCSVFVLEFLATIIPEEPEN